MQQTQSIPLAKLEVVSTLHGQIIDEYGKMRGLVFNYEEETGMILTTPMQPLRLSAIPWTSGIERLSFNNAKALCEQLSIHVDREVLEGASVEGLSGVWGNVRVVVPFSSVPAIPSRYPSLEKNFLLPEQNTVTSQLNTFLYTKQIARLLVEYAKWLYSTYLSTTDDTDTLAIFSDTKLKIISTHSYDSNISNKFSMDSSLLDHGKLILPSSEFQKRLLYVLRVFDMYEHDTLLTYKDLVTIPNFFSSVYDFTPHSENIILKGNHALSKWISEKQTRPWVLRNNVDQTASTYFMQNPNIMNNQICLMQKEDDLESAVERARYWKQHEINTQVGENAADPFLNPFSLYSYRNQDEIDEFTCKEQDCVRQQGEDKVAVLGYKNEGGDSEFVSILPLPKCST